MTKRTALLTVAAVLVLLAASGAAYAITRPATTPHFWAKAKATRATAACVAANPKLNVPKNTRNDIEIQATGYLADVPAGTNVDVRLATYSPTRVTGSDYYASKYGTYNFVMVKDSQGWRFTDFKRCY